jgi:hypothetical protein
MARTQPIHAIELVREIRDQLARETEGMSAEQLVAFYRDAGRASTPPALKSATPRKGKASAPKQHAGKSPGKPG